MKTTTFLKATGLTILMMLLITFLSNAQTVYHVARYCDSEAAAQIFNNHTDEFVIDYSIGCWNGATFDANVHEFTKEDIDVIFIGGDNTFSISTALAIEEAIYNDGKVFMLNFWSNRNFNASLPAVNAGDAPYGEYLTVEDPGNPIFEGLPDIFYNTGPNYNREHAIEKEGSTVLMRFDNGDPALLYWQYGNGYVIEWTLECMHEFIELEDLDLINYRLLKFLLEGSTFMLISPNGGEYLEWNTQQLINWTISDSLIENVSLWLSYNSGFNYDDLLFEHIANDGAEPWTIPEAQCNTARIKIEGYDADGLLVAEDESDSDFIIYTTPPIYLDSGLVAYYPFNGNANDESENDNTGDVYGAVLTTDRFGDADKAYSFDGIDDHIVVDDHESLRPTSVTISCFVKFDSPYGGHLVTKNIGNGNWESYTLFCWPSVNSVVSCISTINGHGNILQAPFNYENVYWHHLVFTFDDPGDIEKIFIDGTLVSQATETNSIAYDDKPLYISGELDYSTPSYFCKGKIDDVRIYDRALNQLEIQALYHEGDWKVIPSFTAELDDHVVCKNESIVFEVNVEGLLPIQYQWQQDGVGISGATFSVLTLPHVQPEDGGEYRCIATNDYGSDTSNTALLTVEFAIPTNINGLTNVNEYQLATYSVGLQEGHLCDFIVEGGNRIDGTENSITVHWGESGDGLIKLLETSELGCVADTNTLYVTIGALGIEDHESQILSVSPNPFTRSIMNEYEALQVGNAQIKIFNQWGKLVGVMNEKSKVGKNSFTLNANGLPPGIYLLHLQTGNELITKKIIKL